MSWSAFFSHWPEINTGSEEEALRQLEAFLQPRVEAAEQEDGRQ